MEKIWFKRQASSLRSFNQNLTSADDIYRISFSGQDNWQDDLCKRYTRLAALSDTLPASIIIPSVPRSEEREQFDLDGTAEWFSRILKDYREIIDETQSNTQAEHTANSAVENGQVNKTALCMALCGWTGQDIAGVKIASCEKCFARVGLWMYKSSTSSVGDDHKLDPVQLHRTHCPWQNATSQDGLGRFAGLAGWEILNEIIGSNISRARRQKGLSDSVDEDLSDTEESSRPSREQIEDEDRARESKLARLRRALTVKKSKKTLDSASK
jgi:Rsm1-like